MEEKVEAPVDAKQAAEEKFANFAFGPEEADLPKEEVEEPTEEVEAQEEDTEEVEAAPEEEQPEETVVEIEVDGELLEVPEKYKDYFLRQQDYTQKTQAIADERRQVEVLQGQAQQKLEEFEFAQSVWDDVILAQQKNAEAEQWTQYLKDNIDALSATDIEKVRMAREEALTEAQNIATQVQQKQNEFQQSREQSFTELLNKGTEVLKQRIPGWGEDHQGQVRDYGLKAGFSEQELNTVIDPRQVEVLWKAAQYDALQEGKTAAVKKVQSAPKIKAKSRQPMQKEVGDKLNLRKKLKNPNKSPSDKKRDMEKYMQERWGI